MIDKYGTEIVEGSLLVTKENTGPVPGRVWLGIAVKNEEWPWSTKMVFKSANMEVALHEHQSELWQVVLPPKGVQFLAEVIK